MVRRATITQTDDPGLYQALHYSDYSEDFYDFDEEESRATREKKRALQRKQERKFKRETVEKAPPRKSTPIPITPPVRLQLGKKVSK